MPTTPIYALRYPAASDIPDVPTDMSELALDVEANMVGKPASLADGEFPMWDSGTSRFVRSTTAGKIAKFSAAGLMLGGDTVLSRVAAKQLQIGSAAMPTALTISADNTVWPFVIYDNATPSYPRMYNGADGSLWWGSGTGSADTNLYRQAADVLRTDDSFYIGGNLGLGDVGTLMVKTSGRITELKDGLNVTGGTYGIGIGTAATVFPPAYGIQFGADVTLYRWGADFLKTDDNFIAVGNIYGGAIQGNGAVIAYNADSFWETIIGYTTGAAGPGIWFSAARDVGLWRNAAGVLKTGAQFHADGGFNTNVGSAGAAALYAAGLAADGYIIASRKATDTQWRVLFDANGMLSWGPGGTAGTDVSLFRAGVGALKTYGEIQTGAGTGNSLTAFGHIVQNNGSMWLRGDAIINFGATDDTRLYRNGANILATDGQLYFKGGDNSYLVFQRPGDAQARFFINPYGTIYFGDGAVAQDNWLYRYDANGLAVSRAFSAEGAIVVSRKAGAESSPLYFGSSLDTNLYRVAANMLATDDSLWVSREVYVDTAGAGYKLLFGAANDVNLYRAAADTLKTDDTFQVGNSFYALGGVITPANIGTAFPGSPADGQIFTLVDSLTAPTYAWTFRYVAGISDANKWVFIGGSPLGAEAAQSHIASGYTTIASVTAPRAGNYFIHAGCASNSGVGSTNPRLTINAVQQTIHSVSGSWSLSIALDVHKAFTGISAGHVIAVQASANGTDTSYSQGSVSILPIRVA